jgi:hypothetical protein
MKVCYSCNEEKALTEFYKNRAKKDGFADECKNCNKLRAKKYREDNREKIAEWQREYRKKPEYKRRKNALARQANKVKPDLRRNAMLKYMYGITLDQYNKILKDQDYRCAVCKKHESNEKRSLHVDHDHNTGEIRGLLCNYCNSRFIGRHRDPERYRQAAEYLAQGTGLYVPEDKKKPKRRRKKKK